MFDVKLTYMETIVALAIHCSPSYPRHIIHLLVLHIYVMMNNILLIILNNNYIRYTIIHLVLYN